MTEFAPDFTKLNEASMITMDARKVPKRVWQALQPLHRELLRRQMMQALPMDANQDAINNVTRRSVQMTYGVDTAEYAKRHSRYGHFRGQGGTQLRQSFANPRMTLVFDHREGLVGGVATVQNTSSSERLPRFAGRVHEQLKMHPVPHTGLEGHRYVKIGDIVGEPEAAVAGLVGALENRPRTDRATLYYAPEDSADLHMGRAARALGMLQVGSGVQSGVPGYPENLLVETRRGLVSEMLQHVSLLDGVARSLDVDNLPRLDELPDRWRGDIY